MPHPPVVQSGRDRIAEIAERRGEETFAREVRAGAWDSRNDVRRMIFDESMKVHQIKGAGISGFAQRVTLYSSDNPYMVYPVNGVLVINEQGVDLSIIKAVFHQLHEDNTLGPPVSVGNPVFATGGRNERS